MRVTINHFEKQRGLVRRKTLYGIGCKVDFSDEEKQIIKQRKLGDYIILQWPVNEAQNDLKFCAEHGVTTNNLKIEDLNGKTGVGHVFPIPTDARQHEQNLTEALKTMKEFVMANAEMEKGSTSFEL